jgi:fatty-acyl-CoA synthase
MTVACPLTLTNAFDRAARWFPDNEAVVDSRERLTFRQLDEMTRRCAALLRAAGVEPGQPIALMTAPSALHFVALFGAIRLGAIPLVLHTRESPAVLAAVCRRIGATALIYDASMEPAAAAIMAACGDMRAMVRGHSALPAKPDPAARPFADLDADLARYPADAPLHRPAEDDPAVIVLSSGTTSAPKGVVHSHRNMVELARTDVYMYGGLYPSDRSLVPLSTAFIACYNGWLPFFNVGACTIFLEHFDLDRCLALIPEEKVTHFMLTPTLWRRALNALPAEIDMRSIRQIGFGAEIMDATTMRGLHERICPNVIQVYGSTETGAGAACNWSQFMEGERLTSVGRPLLNGDIRVVVPGGGPDDEVPQGELGEVLITNPSIAIGIWGDPEMTAKTFVEHGGRRWWRSRDLGRLDPEGFLYLGGRSDDMIISGGINILPSRVEEVLIRHAGVADCAVIGVPHPEWGEQVHAFVIAKDAGLDAATLDAFVRASDLSPYQRPRAYVFVEEFPRTATNKVNRRALRETAKA